MVHRRTPSDLNDYWEIFLRRKWWILVPAVVVGMIVFAVSSKLPRSYQSDTLILVDPQKVPSEYVKATVSIDVSDRLQTISQEILSRTRLQKIIDQFGLYKEAKAVRQCCTRHLLTSPLILGLIEKRMLQIDNIKKLEAGGRDFLHSERLLPHRDPILPREASPSAANARQA